MFFWFDGNLLVVKECVCSLIVQNIMCLNKYLLLAIKLNCKGTISYNNFLRKSYFNSGTNHIPNELTCHLFNERKILNKINKDSSDL